MLCLQATQKKRNRALKRGYTARGVGGGHAVAASNDPDEFGSRSRWDRDDEDDAAWQQRKVRGPQGDYQGR